MKLLKGIEIPVSICISYTILSVFNAASNLLLGREAGPHMNSLMMLLWCSIAIFVLSIHHWFDEWSPIAMIAMQYLIALGLVMLSVWISSFFEELSRHGYRDCFISFTVPYVIGAALYYISLFRTARRQDRLIQEINSARGEE